MAICCMDDTDLLRKRLAPSSFIVVDGPHGKHMEDGERVFIKNGQLQGSIALVNQFHKIVKSSLLDEYSQYVDILEKTGRCVGNILVGYSSDSSKDLEWWGGSGFRISETLVATAAHVVKPIHVEEGIVYSLKKIYISFEPLATSDNLPTKQLDGLPYVFELEAIDGSREIDKKFPIDLVFQISGKPDYHWDTKNDFAFLHFKKNKPLVEAVPIASMANPADLNKISPQASLFVVGYPGAITQNKFIEDYAKSLHKDETVKLFEETRLKMGGMLICHVMVVGFDRKVISLGPSTPCNHLAYKCPSLRQMSGGLIGCLEAMDETQIKFVGIHVGGAERMDNNFGIPVAHAAFQDYYKQHVTI